MSSLAYTLADGAVVAKRNLIKITRVPELLVWTLMSPIMFVLLFGYVFGSSIATPGMNYREFFMAGIFVQTVAFGSTWTGAGMAEDMTKGIIDRFRSLPMSRSAVLMGRTLADAIFYNSTSIVVMAITGLLAGWRIRTNPLQALGGFALLLLFAYAVSWVMAYAGLKAKTVEAVNNASFMFIFPMTFVSNAFVPADNLPGPLKAFSNWNPVSSVTQAVREAFGNVDPRIVVPDVWSLNNPVLYSLICIAAILAIFIPLSVRQYNKASSR
jgi:ABC transporter DrrB family efflux protein